MTSRATASEAYLRAAADAGLLHTVPGLGRYTAGEVDRGAPQPYCLVEHCDDGLLADGAAALLADLRQRHPEAGSVLLRAPGDTGLPDPWQPAITYLRFTRPPGAPRPPEDTRAPTAPAHPESTPGTPGTPNAPGGAGTESSANREQGAAPGPGQGPDPGHSVRPAAPGDDPLILGWLHEALARGARQRQEELDEEAVRAGAEAILASPGRESWVYLAGTVPVGHLTVRTEEFDEVTGAPYVDLVDMLVEPPHDRGATAPLVSAAARRSAELGRPLLGNVIHSVSEPGRSALILARLEAGGWQCDHRFWQTALPPSAGPAEAGGHDHPTGTRTVT